MTGGGGRMSEQWVPSGTHQTSHGLPAAFELARAATEAQTLPELAGLLRQLRRREARQQGETLLTYRQLAAKTGWSRGIIGEYFAGNILPPPERFDALIRLLGATPAEQGVLATARDRVEERRRRPNRDHASTGRAVVRARAGGPRTGTPYPRFPVPRQLPPALPGFVGRATQLAQLDAECAGAVTPEGDGVASVTLMTLSGTAGVGKTTLAVTWAHRVADRFPDGQLYVDLRGFDSTGTVVTAVEAVRGFLEALEVPPERIPTHLPAQVGLYRSLLAGRRMLVLLDNARDADQVRPLLVGSSSCLVLVTSRNRLAGLVATEGARPIGVDLLSTAEAWQLLARRLGADRLAAEPQAVDEIIERCARLPLALAVLAARGAEKPAFPLAALAAELRAAPRPLDSFDGGDAGTDVQAVFSWSYRSLTPQAARVFRLFGCHPGPDMGFAAAASLAGLPRAQVPRLLAELAHAHLVTEHTPAGSARTTCSGRTRPSRSNVSNRRRPDGPRSGAGWTTTCTPRTRRRCCCNRAGTRSPSPPSHRVWCPRRSPTSVRRWPGSASSIRCCWLRSPTRGGPGSTAMRGSWPGHSWTSCNAGGGGRTWPWPSGTPWPGRSGPATDPGRRTPTATSPGCCPGWVG